MFQNLHCDNIFSFITKKDLTLQVFWMQPPLSYHSSPLNRLLLIPGSIQSGLTGVNPCQRNITTSKANHKLINYMNFIVSCSLKEVFIEGRWRKQHYTTATLTTTKTGKIERDGSTSLIKPLHQLLSLRGNQQGNDKFNKYLAGWKISTPITWREVPLHKEMKLRRSASNFNIKF